MKDLPMIKVLTAYLWKEKPFALAMPQRFPY